MSSLSLLPFKRGNDGSSFNDDQLIAYLLDLHFAGTDTTANTVLFAILYLMTYPAVQGVYFWIPHQNYSKCWATHCPSGPLHSSERFHQELDRVLDGKGQISFEDRHQMPYVQVQHFKSLSVSVFQNLGILLCLCQCRLFFMRVRGWRALFPLVSSTPPRKTQRY